MEDKELLQELMKITRMRSADRANIVTMLGQLKKSMPLNYQQRLNLWAYAVRYDVAGGVTNSVARNEALQ